MSQFRERPCRECERGTLRLLKGPLRTWRYKRFMLAVPAEFEIPTCDNCGEQWLNPEMAAALDDVLSQQYSDKLVTLIEQAIEVLHHHCSQRALEKLLGLSQGYLSKILGRKKVPSEALVTGLVLLARDPKVRLLEAEESWSEVPPAWLIEKAQEEGNKHV